MSQSPQHVDEAHNPEHENGQETANGNLEHVKADFVEENKDEFRQRADSRDSFHSRSRDGSEGRGRRRSPSDRGRRRSRSDSRRSRSYRSRTPEQAEVTAQLYVGGIDRRCNERDLREAFDKFGPIREVTLKGRYAFVEFENLDDAKAACSELNNTKIQGAEVKVEHSSK